MSGISDKAINKLTNQNKFNGGVELEEDYGVNIYSTFCRQYDPQLGRFGRVDILSEQSAALSGYHFSGNNPISFNDPMGDKFIDRTTDETWHHADGLAGTLADGQGFQAGFGWDGFGGGYGGPGGETSDGGGFGGGNSTSGDYSAFWNKILSDFDGSGNGGVLQYNYTNTCGSSFLTPHDHGEKYFDNAENEQYYFTGTSVLYEVNSEGSSQLGGEGGKMEGGNFWGNMGIFFEGGLSYETTADGGKALQILAYGEEAVKIGSKGVSRSIAVSGLAISVMKGLTNPNGWQNHNSADVVISAATTVVTFLELSNPVGWSILGAEALYFIGNEIYESHNDEHKSITESLFD